MMMISRMPMLASLLRYPNDRCDKLVAKVIENRRVGYIAAIRSVRAVRTAYQLANRQSTEKRLACTRRDPHPASAFVLLIPNVTLNLGTGSPRLGTPRSVGSARASMYVQQ